MRWIANLNIRQKWLAIASFLTATIATIGLYSNYKSAEILKEQVTHTYIELIKQTHIILVRDLDAVNQITSKIVQNPYIQQLVPDPMLTTQERVRRYVAADDLLRSYSTGTALAESIWYSMFIPDPQNWYSFAPKYDLVARGVFFFRDDERPPWYDEAMRLKGKGFLKVIDGFGFGGRKNLAFLRSVHDLSGGGYVLGVLAVTNLDTKLYDDLRSVSLPDGEIYVTDESGRLLAGGRGELGAGIELPRMRAVGVDASVELSDGDPNFLYIAHGPSVYGTKLVFKIPISALTRQLSELQRTILLITVVDLAATVLFVFYFLQAFVRPLHKMAEFFKRYEIGDVMRSFSGRRRDEIGILAASIREMTERLNALIKDKYVMEIRQKESQLRLLYSQINPHLLYNTLESIYWHCRLNGESESAEMIRDLSKLMKLGLSRGKELIPLEQELEHVRAYISLQQKRYAYRFRVSWDVQAEALGCLTPKIVLQPLVENAILHGVRHMGDEGMIRISARTDGDEVCVVIEDNGYKPADIAAMQAMLADETTEAPGYGVRNVHQRIRLHFGNRYGLAYSRGSSGGTRVEVRWPVVREDSEIEGKGERIDVQRADRGR